MDRELGRQFLLLLKDCLDAASVPFFLMQGTALGAYRDKDFTPTERDIDLGVLWEDFHGNAATIQQELFKFDVDSDCSDRNTPNGWAHTLVATYKGVKADIVSWFKHGDNRFAVAPDFVKPHYCIVHDAHIIEEVAKWEMFGKEFMIPVNIYSYLEREYGPDWRTPREDHVSRSRVYGYLDKVPDWSNR